MFKAGDRVVLLRVSRDAGGIWPLGRWHWTEHRGDNKQFPGDTGTVQRDTEEGQMVPVKWDNGTRDPCWVSLLLDFCETYSAMPDTRSYLEAVAK